MNLLRIELHKLLPYRTAWVILGIFAGLLLLVLYAAGSFSINGSAVGADVYRFPNLWQTLTYVASYFNLLLGILVIVLISDEYSFRTLRQQVIDGLSRAELVLAKFYVILGLAAVATLYLLALGLYFGLLYSSVKTGEAILGKVGLLSYYFVQATGYMALAMLAGFLIKKSGLAIIAFIAYAKIVEPLIHFSLPDEVDKYFPMKVLSSLTPMPGQELVDQLTSPTGLLSPVWATLPAIGYIGVFLLLSFVILKLRDL